MILVPDPGTFARGMVVSQAPDLTDYTDLWIKIFSYSTLVSMGDLQLKSFD